MNDKLAERLLANVMNWEPSDDAKERPILQSLAAFKYDDYQPFSPGLRFLESLALWLKQFATHDERITAYNFVRKKMLFISPREMFHLVSIAYPNVIRQLLITEVAKKKNCPEWLVNKIVNSEEFKILRRQSLFLGLSDGARIDTFRRTNPQLSNEQILRSHEIPKGRAIESVDKLIEDLTKIKGQAPEEKERKFRMVYLLDDFSGSGLSYLREKKSGYGGKIGKFFESACKATGDINDLFNVSKLHVCLILYVASNNAKEYLEHHGKKLFKSIPFSVKIVYPLPKSVKINDQNDPDFIELLKKYYDKTIEDSHYLVGKHDKPYMGFDECGLPLVLSHNAPNNSVGLLWYYENKKYRGLFPRISRHRD